MIVIGNYVLKGGQVVAWLVVKKERGLQDSIEDVSVDEDEPNKDSFVIILCAFNVCYM